MQLERDVPADGEPAHLLFTARQSLLQRLGLCAAPDAAARSLLSPGVFLVDRHCILERKHGTNSWPLLHLLAVDVLGAPGELPDPVLRWHGTPQCHFWVWNICHIGILKDLSIHTACRPCAASQPSWQVLPSKIDAHYHHACAMLLPYTSSPSSSCYFFL